MEPRKKWFEFDTVNVKSDVKSARLHVKISCNTCMSEQNGCNSCVEEPTVLLDIKIVTHHIHLVHTQHEVCVQKLEIELVQGRDKCQRRRLRGRDIQQQNIGISKRKSERE